MYKTTYGIAFLKPVLAGYCAGSDPAGVCTTRVRLLQQHWGRTRPAMPPASHFCLRGSLNIKLVCQSPSQALQVEVAKRKGWGKKKRF